MNSAEGAVRLRRVRALRRMATIMMSRARPEKAPITPPAIAPFWVDDISAFSGRELAGGVCDAGRDRVELVVNDSVCGDDEERLEVVVVSFVDGFNGETEEDEEDNGVDVGLE